MQRSRFRPATSAAMLVVASACVSGCAVANLIGGAAQNAEYQKKIEVPAAYDGLGGKEVAVLVDVNMAMMYEYPALSRQVAYGLAYSIQTHVAGAKVIPPETTMHWQYATPNWSLMAYSDIGRAIGAERIVLVEIYEFRLNPPGNRYEWDGVCAANVRVIEVDEQDDFATDLPAEEFDVVARFPDQQGVVWESTTADKIEAGVILKFLQHAGWLFYLHEEPKYPDKYRPELDQ